MINTVTAQSYKLLATTTELVDPSKIKQIEYIVNPNGQIQSISNKESTLTIDNKNFIVQLPEIGEINLGATESFKIDTLADTGAVSGFGKNTNTLLYIPEPTDSIITANDTTKSKIIINQETVIDKEQ